MRNPLRGGRQRRRLGRIVPVVGLALALAAGGLVTAHAQAGEPAPRPALSAPKGFEVTDPPAAPGTGSDEPAKDARIIGGTSTAFSSAPWMVQLLFSWDHDGLYYFTCGGTLVAPNKVLTAAHCLHDENGVRQDWGKYGAVLAGTSKLLGGPDNSEGEFVDVTRSWVRDGYDHNTVDNDVALLTLAKPLKHKTLSFAEPADTALYAEGTKGTAYGWGLTGSNGDTGELSSTLLRASLTLNSDAACAENLDGALGEGAFKPGSMICTGPAATGDDATATTVCPGDSGGPLVAGGKIVGVVSWGVSAGNQVCNVSGTYEVFTRIGTYAPKFMPRIDDTDLNRSGRADLFARAATGGKAYQYISEGTSFAPRQALSGSWSAYNLVLQADMNRDGYQDFIIRRRSDGAMYWRHRSATSSTYVDTKIASDWGTRKFTAAPGDVTGDRFPDLLSVTSGGTLYLYPGKGDGTYQPRITAGSGYSGYNSLRGKGDFTGDGKPDLLARAGGGAVYLLPGTGKAAAPFGARIKVRDWAQYNGFAATGDMTGDGRADYLARSSSGTLYLYPGTGKSTSEIFATPVKIGNGWNQYNIFG
ncbi:trypsin-like serine protease [Streptomyces pathocidini]|uniref:trypsin-like serine protease n=1 Tax=Streptomyces pathocidini TaxID=1650571 RepID=UPI0033E9D35B